MQPLPQGLLFLGLQVFALLLLVLSVLGVFGCVDGALALADTVLLSGVLFTLGCPKLGADIASVVKIAVNISFFIKNLL